MNSWVGVATPALVLKAVYFVHEAAEASLGVLRCGRFALTEVTPVAGAEVGAIVRDMA